MNLPEIFASGLEKVSHIQRTLHGEFPHITQNGSWLTSENGHWTGGFWTGLLWLKALYENNEEEKLSALKQVRKLAVRMRDNKTHDMGFIFGPSCILGNRIQPDPHLVEMAIAGAHNMEDLFEEKTGLVLAWDEPGYEGVAIVDTIMNVPLMIWVANQENNPSLYDKAITIADHIRQNHIRPDHSTYHVVRWDTKTFQIVERSTHQGFGPETCWSRGQAWALYGFANMYRYTLQAEYLETSERLAEYFWTHLDDDLYLPRWDFFFKNQAAEPLDAAAASIAASGMILLSSMLKRRDRRDESALWKQRGKLLIESLVKNCFYKDLDRYGIIARVTVDKPRNSGVNESSMYGDYYFMEALHRLMNYNDEKMSDILY